jgi:hypothetical protein
MQTFVFCVDLDKSSEMPVEQSRCDSLVELADVLVRGNDRRESLVVTMIENLI